MTKLASGPGPHKPDDDRARVVIAGLLTAGGFFGGVAPILVISGTWSLNDGTVRYVVTMGSTVLVLALLPVGCYVVPSRRREPPGPRRLGISCQCRDSRATRAQRRLRDRATGPVTRSRTRRRRRS